MVNMQFDEAGLVVVPIRWYFAASTAEPLASSHLFGSSNWQKLDIGAVGPGERWDSVRTYDKGENPYAIPGTTGPCGPADWFANGVPSDAPPLDLDFRGVPICCHVPVIQPGEVGIRVGPQWAPCQPWHIFGPPVRVFKRLSTGETWIATLNTTVQWSGHGVVHTTEIVNVQPGGIGCQGFNLTKPIAMITPSTGGTVHLTLLSYDPATFTGTWQMGANSIRYAGERFTWRNPT